MLYMVIEHFKNRDAKAVYGRFRKAGRMMPQGLRYVSSWVEVDFARCFQLVETEDTSLLELWKEEWRDLIDFEIVAVRTSADAFSLVSGE